MHIKFKFLLKINNEIKYNSFNNISNDFEKEYLTNSNNLTEIIQWRNKKNQEYDITHLDQEIDYIKSEKIFNSLNLENLINIDMNEYTFPSVIRNVLTNMKRNEIRYIKCTDIDYLQCDNLELYNIKDKKIDIYIHLFEFREMPLFGKYPYEDKFDIISNYKKIADDCFKASKNNKGKLYRAMKIYHKLKYRFSGGDVFGYQREEAEKYLKEKNYDLYKKLFDLRIKIYNNLGVCLMRLDMIDNCYSVSKELLNLFDENNPKALYLYGKACLIKNYNEDAIKVLKKLKEIQGDNQEVEEILKEAENKINSNINKQLNLFKKMFKANN